MPGAGLAAHTNKSQTFVKARRFTKPADTFEPAAHIHKTIHRDRKTGRMRDCRPGEPSLYDDIQASGVRFFTSETGTPWKEDSAPDGLFYNDIDAAEDVILFPEETFGHAKKAIGEADDPITVELENRFPSFKRFILDLDSDDDSDDYDDPMETGLTGRKANRRKTLTEQEPSHPDMPEDLPSCPSPDDPECECPACLDIIEQRTASDANEGAEDDNMSVYSEDFDANMVDKQLADRVKDFAFEQKAPDDRDVAIDFKSFVDRDSAKIFKKSWHAAELDPELSYRWKTMQQCLSAVKREIMEAVPTRVMAWELLHWMEVHTNGDAGDRAVWSDITNALAAMSMFFPPADNALGRSTYEQHAQKSLFTNNEYKAKMTPYARFPQSNKHLPKDVWNAVDKQVQETKETRRIPPEWDAYCRPIVAKLFKTGILGLGYCPYPEGYAIVVDDPSLGKGMCIDYRREEAWPTFLFDVPDPTKIDLLPRARRWAEKHPSAKFAFFRIWTHALFLPLMVGIPNRLQWSFKDTINRSWVWKFVSKSTERSRICLISMCASKSTCTTDRRAARLQMSCRRTATRSQLFENLPSHTFDHENAY